MLVRIAIRNRLALAALGAAAMCAPSDARAQNALGDGRALDNNLQVGASRINPRSRDLLAEIRFRNAIVTGNAPAGMSLRVDVGYFAADDFRADESVFGGGLGSNELFAFNRDALLSTVAGQGIRGIDALQVQMRLSTGATVDDATGLPYIPIVERSGAGASFEQALARESRAALVDPFRLRPSGLRSTTEFLAGDSLAPVILGVAAHEGERRFAVASPLRGVQTQTSAPDDALPLTPDLLRSILPAPPLLEPPDADEARPGRSGESAEDEGVDGRVDARLSNRLENRPDSTLVSYDAIMNRLSQRLQPEAEEDEEAPPLAPSRQPEVETPQPGEPPAEAAQPGGEAEGADAADRRDQPGRSAGVEALRRRIDEMRGALLGLRDERSEPGEELTIEEAIAEARRLLGGEAPLVGRLAPPPANDRDFFAEHMARGEALLAQGQYFHAEERFSRALSVRPGEPMAAIGRAHAQLGAGLFLSAGASLERLLLARPELVNLRYSEDLLPSPARRAALKADLERLATREGPMRARAALLLAYLGWQEKDLDAARAGLDALRAQAEQAGATDPLERMLRAVWLGEGP